MVIMTNKLIISALLIGGLTYISACITTKLTIEKQNYKGNQLRIDGYYYQKHEGKYYSLYFFYRDGTILYGGGGFTEKELLEQEKQFTSEAWLKATRNSKIDWGVFIINDGSIAFERWYPSSGGVPPVYLRSGKILNDTTFVINKAINSGKPTEQRTKNETYFFKEFSPKPDSTNPYTQ